MSFLRRKLRESKEGMNLTSVDMVHDISGLNDSTQNINMTSMNLNSKDFWSSARPISQNIPFYSSNKEEEKIINISDDEEIINLSSPKHSKPKPLGEPLFHKKQQKSDLPPIVQPMNDNFAGPRKTPNMDTSDNMFDGLKEEESFTKLLNRESDTNFMDRISKIEKIKKNRLQNNASINSISKDSQASPFFKAEPETTSTPYRPTQKMALSSANSNR